MSSELSDKFADTENPPEDAVRPGTRADIFFSSESVRKDYDYYLGMLRSYGSGEIAMDPLKARKIGTNTKTVGLILERVKEDDYEAAQRRLRRAAALMDELKQECAAVVAYRNSKELQ